MALLKFNLSNEIMFSFINVKKEFSRFESQCFSFWIKLQKDQNLSLSIFIFYCFVNIGHDHASDKILEWFQML